MKCRLQKWHSVGLHCLCFIGFKAMAELPITQNRFDSLNRITNISTSYSAQHIRYDAAGNRTSYSSTLAFSVAAVTDQQMGVNDTLSVPIATTGSVRTEQAEWVVRSSNRALVPKSGLEVLDPMTSTPRLRITPVTGAVGSTRITLIANPSGARTIAAATSFVLNVGANRPPLAINDSAQHPPGGGTKIERGKLLANDSDPDHDPISLVSLSATSAHGGQVRFFGPFVAYDPPAGYDGPDFFTYLLLDNHGATDSATVTLKSQPPNQAIPSTVVATEMLPSGNRLVTFIGLPATTYSIQVSLDLLSWTTVGTTTSDSRGRYQFEDADTQNFPARFYRAVFQ